MTLFCSYIPASRHTCSNIADPQSFPLIFLCNYYALTHIIQSTFNTRVRVLGGGYYSVEETASSRVNFITKFTKANLLKPNNNTSNLHSPIYTYILTHTYTISQIYNKNNAILWYETFLFA